LLRLAGVPRGTVGAVPRGVGTGRGST
jgi:hypothetical protein